MYRYINIYMLMASSVKFLILHELHTFIFQIENILRSLLLFITRHLYSAYLIIQLP